MEIEEGIPMGYREVDNYDDTDADEDDDNKMMIRIMMNKCG